MIETFNKIINNQSFERVSSLTVIQCKNFLNEVIPSHNLRLIRLMFSHLTFLNCNFPNILFLQSELDNCSFKNSKIFKSDFSRENFLASYLIDCDDLDMGEAVFTECEFIKDFQQKIHHFYNLENTEMIRDEKHDPRNIEKTNCIINKTNCFIAP